MIIDVHAHLDLLEAAELKNVIQRAKLERVKCIITNSVDLNSCKKNLEIFKRHKIVKLAAGLYPEKTLKKSSYKDFEKFVFENRKNIIALGEIGLDLFHVQNNFKVQKEIFEKQLNLAKKLHLPVIIHTRKAEKEVLDILQNYSDLKIILHCFSGKFTLIKKAINLGCFFSIPTNIVFSEHFQEMVKILPRDKILTETDTPFLSPYKGIKNEPAFIKETIKILSEEIGISEAETENIIEANAKQIFGNL